MTATMIEKDQEFVPVEYRDKLKSGMITDGLFVVAGDEKTGKTALLASFPDSYILELDPSGGDRLSGRFHDIKDLKTFRAAFKWAMNEPSIKTIGIDTLTGLSDLFEKEVAAAYGLESMSERKPGVDGFEVWDSYNSKIENLVEYIKSSGKLVVTSVHLRPPKTDDKGTIVAPASIDLYPRAARVVGTKADVIGQTFKKQLAGGAEYYLSFKGSVSGKLGSRVDELNDKEIKLPKANPYSAFEALFKTPAK